MLKVIIHWTYYKENHWYSSWNARQKKDCVYFYDYDQYIDYILKQLDYSELQRLRLNIYNRYQKLIKFTKFWEVDLDWNRFEWLKLESPLIELDYTDFVELLPSSSIRKRFFEFDNIREKYYLRSDFINYIKFGYVV